MLADVLERVGIPLEQSENYSNRVCNPCGRKNPRFFLRLLDVLYDLLEVISAKPVGEREESTKRPFGEQTP